MIKVCVFPNTEFSARLIDTVKRLHENYNKICYVSLNRPTANLMNLLNRHNLNLDKFFFVDTLTQTTLKGSELASNCRYVSAPDALTELSCAISDEMTKQKFDVILFDSLSTLLLYENVNMVVRFVHALSSHIQVADCEAVFTCLEEETHPELMSELVLFVDEIEK